MTVVKRATAGAGIAVGAALLLTGCSDRPKEPEKLAVWTIEEYSKADSTEAAHEFVKAEFGQDALVHDSENNGLPEVRGDSNNELPGKCKVDKGADVTLDDGGSRKGKVIRSALEIPVTCGDGVSGTATVELSEQADGSSDRPYEIDDLYYRF